MQINIEVFSKVILSFWMSVTSHAQSTQNNFAYLCNISIKEWGMKAQSTKKNLFTISFQHLKENVKDEVDF